MCEPHKRELNKLFKPRSKQIKQTKRVYTEKSFALRRKKYDAMWAERKKRVLALLTKEPVNVSTLLKPAKMNEYTLMSSLRRLRADDKVKREGWSRSARWSLV